MTETFGIVIKANPDRSNGIPVESGKPGIAAFIGGACFAGYVVSFHGSGSGSGAVVSAARPRTSPDNAVKGVCNEKRIAMSNYLFRMVSFNQKFCLFRNQFRLNGINHGIGTVIAGVIWFGLVNHLFGIAESYRIYQIGLDFVAAVGKCGIAGYQFQRRDFKCPQGNRIIFLVFLDVKAEFGEVSYKLADSQGSDKAD